MASNLNEPHFQNTDKARDNIARNVNYFQPLVSRVCLLAPDGEFRADSRGKRIFDLHVDGECLFSVLNSLTALAELVQCQTYVQQISASPLRSPTSRSMSNACSKNWKARRVSPKAPSPRQPVATPAVGARIVRRSRWRAFQFVAQWSATGRAHLRRSTCRGFLPPVRVP